MNSLLQIPLFNTQFSDTTPKYYVQLNFSHTQLFRKNNAAEICFLSACTDSKPKPSTDLVFNSMSNQKLTTKAVSTERNKAPV